MTMRDPMLTYYLILDRPELETVFILFSPHLKLSILLQTDWNFHNCDFLIDEQFFSIF